MAFGNKKVAPAKTDAERLASLETAFQSVAEQNQRMGGLVASLLAGSQAQYSTTGNGKGSAAVATGIDRAKLPNPADDPDKFFEALDAQITHSVASAIGNVSKAVEADRTANTNRQTFWDDMSTRFDRKYQDLAGDDKAPVVTEAAKKVVARLNARGVDPERYAAIDPEGWMAQVAEEARAVSTPALAVEAGVPQNDAGMGVGNDGASGAPLTLGSGAASVAGDDDGRAASLGGGDNTNIVAGAAASAKGAKKGPESLFGELKAFQEKHRLTA